MGAPASPSSPTAAAAVGLAGRVGTADTHRGGGRQPARRIFGHRRLQAHCGSSATGPGHRGSGGLADERGRGTAPGPFAAPFGTGDRTGTGVAAGGVRAALWIRTGGTGAPVRSKRELGIAPGGAG